MDSPHSLFVSDKFDVTMSWILRVSRDAVCSGPRDKIFGVLGLIDWSPNGGIPTELTPDYTRTVSEVYTSAAKWVSRPSNLDVGAIVLTQTSHRSDEDLHIDGLPSWVPRWHRSWDGEQDSRTLREYYRFSDNVAQNGPFEGNNTFEWHVRGFRIDMIFEVVQKRSPGPKWSWPNFTRDYVIPLQNYLSKTRHSAEDYTRSCVLTADTWMNEEGLSSLNAENLTKCLLSEPLFSEEIEDSETAIVSVSNACRGRIIAATTAGRPELVPFVTRENDIVVWIEGTWCPTVLRPCTGGVEVIGEAYVHGIMKGEVLEEWRASEQPLENFCLV